MIHCLEFVYEALDEAEAATKYYEEVQPGLGVRFARNLRLLLQPSCPSLCFGGNASAASAE